jgi:3'-phosphoadenosine 5'-phosphosulfate sulfotransferase (PAPS reductase)/FAD synthetase
LITHKDYEQVVIAFSGKDSLACLLHCLELGFPVEKIELWHHLVDGNGPTFIDWPCSGAYVKAIGKAFNIPVYFSYRDGGFKRELLRENCKSSAVFFETPHGIVKSGGDRGNGLTRRQFPQVGAIRDGRWCSSLCKINVGDKALTHQQRFKGTRTLFLTGERTSESKQRASYQDFEVHQCDARKTLGRHIDHWRAVHKWSTEDVWQIIRRHKVNPHPCYRAGWGRCSCSLCIFADCDQLASARLVMPEQFAEMAALEREFNKSIQFKSRTRKGHEPEIINIWLEERANRGVPYSGINLLTIMELRDENWDYPIFLNHWEMPLGAFASQNGPS